MLGDTCTDVEAFHDDFRNWYGERKKCGSEGTEKLINRSNILGQQERLALEK